MTNPEELIAALQPLVDRVRTDVTAVRRDGKQAWTREPLSNARLARHLTTGPARGVCPIREGQSTCQVGTLDFDSHGGEVSWPRMAAIAGDVMARLQGIGLFPVAFRSTGGRGVHLHVLWDEPQDAYSVRCALANVLRAAGLKPGTKGLVAGEVEVFPKQNEVRPGKVGNQWILPLAGASILLELDELSGVLVPSPRPLRAQDWRGGVPLVPVERPAAPERVRVPIVDANAPDGTPKWRLALDALMNEGAAELGYDEWLRVIAAVHHETGGSAAGLALAESWSARSKKHDPEFLETRVWPYLRADRAGGAAGVETAAGAGGGTTGGTIMSLASRLHGWSGERAPAEVATEYGPVEDPEDAARAARRERVTRSVVREAPLALCESDDDDISGLGASAANMVALAAAAKRREKAARDAAAAQRAARGGAGGSGGGADGSGDGNGWDGEEEFERMLARVGVPKAEHLCTDQANANRLVRAFGAHLLVAGDRWHVWTGTHWQREEAGLYRHACNLSRLVKAEAARVRARAAARGPDPAALKVADAIAVALDKWSTKCEAKGTIEAAVGLLKKMLTVEPDSLDRNPWLLNCRNGTVDLRTGELREHDPDDRITKLADVDFVVSPGSAGGGGKSVGAASVADMLDREWSRVVLEICGGDVGLAGFLRRWFGYCATGSVREQKFAVLWGGGGNGKSLLVRAIQGVLGIGGARGYCATADEGLMTQGSGRGGSGGGGVHSSAVVALMGRRFVAAHESADGAALAEAFVKRATGDDAVTARFLYGEQFDFDPTHKLNLLSNYRPTIKGQDIGIWRRVLLVPFGVTFGDAGAVERGEARIIADRGLSARFASAPGREAVLRWLVAGAQEWLRGGLAEPDVVLAAGASYRAEQDRVKAFVAECCETGPDCRDLLVGPAGDGVYPGYQAWAKESGLMPMSKQRLLTELARLVPWFAVQERQRRMGGSVKKLREVRGLQMLPDE